MFHLNNNFITTFLGAYHSVRYDCGIIGLNSSNFHTVQIASIR